MEKYRHHSPNKLSVGQKCIVLDEPTAMLDPDGRQEVISTALRLNKEENITIILITHYMDEIVNADKVIVMDKGKVVMTGTPREIFNRPEELEKYRIILPQVSRLAIELSKSLEGFSLPVLTVEELTMKVMEYKNANNTRSH